MTLLALVTKCVRITADFPNAFVKKDLLERTLVKVLILKWRMRRYSM